MDVNQIYLTPVQQAEHLQNNKYLIYHKVGCSTRNHPGPWKSSGSCTYLLKNQWLHNIHSTNTISSLPKAPRIQPINEVNSYFNILHTNQNYYASWQTYVRVQGSTYSEGGTHETLCPQVRLGLRTRNEGTESQPNGLWIHKTNAVIA